MQDESSDLSRYLMGESALGQHQEQGEFTINLGQARLKMAEFSLAEPGLWVVKVVQAAVASQADKIAFTFARKRVTIRFPNCHDWNPNTISAILLQGEDPPDDAYFHLRTGLMAASSEPRDSVSWSCQGQSYILRGEELEHRSCEESDELVLSVSRKSSQKGARTFLAPIRYLIRQTAHEYKALVDRCAQCPIPVTIDGVKLESAYLRPVMALDRCPGFNGEADQGWKLQLAVKPLLSGENRAPLTSPLSVPQRSGGAFATFHWPPLAEPPTAVLCLYQCQQRVSRVNLMLDGVLVEHRNPFAKKSSPLLEKLRAILEDGTRSFVFELFVNTSRERLDLSHFATREEELDDLLLSIVPALRELLEERLEACESRWHFPTPDIAYHFKKTHLANASIVDLGAAFYLSGFLPYYYAIGAAMKVASPLTGGLKRFTEKRRRRVLKPRLEEILDQLRAFSQTEKRGPGPGP